MIRFFELFWRLNLKNISAEDFFLKSMAEFRPHEHKCPFCLVEHPDWKKHAVYDRYLISFENECTISYRVEIQRYKCSYCGHTHAVLPESIIPYRSYSFLFVIAVMKDYFMHSLTVENICVKYDISVSTLYSWKSLFLRQKKVWLGLLNDVLTTPVQFMYSISNGGLLNDLKEFFLTAGVSFLQSTSYLKKAHYAPP